MTDLIQKLQNMQDFFWDVKYSVENKTYLTFH